MVETVIVVKKQRKHDYWFRRFVLLGHVPGRSALCRGLLEI
jgi:hypothetical protein